METCAMAERCVHALWHLHPETDRFEQDWKLIGIYASAREAEQARARVEDKPGFRDHPDGFTVVEHVLNRDGWVEGYVRA